MIMYARLVWSWVEDEVLCLVVSPLVVLVKHLKHLQNELLSRVVSISSLILILNT